MRTEALQVDFDGSPLDARWVTPDQPVAALLLAHGAGAGMLHPFMTALAAALAARDIATLRFNFPFTQAAKRRPDPPKVIVAALAAAWLELRRRAGPLPLLGGGKSMGGRLSAHAVAAAQLPGARGLVYFGFPLHPPKKPARKRGEVLASVGLPQLFLQGDRDALANLDDLRAVLCTVPRHTLTIFDGADHAFARAKRSGKTLEDTLGELASACRQWLDEVLRENTVTVST